MLSVRAVGLGCPITAQLPAAFAIRTPVAQTPWPLGRSTVGLKRNSACRFSSVTSADAVRAAIRNRADFGDVDPYSNRDYRGDSGRSSTLDPCVTSSVITLKPA